MANAFLISTVKLIALHGQQMQYKSVTEGSYNIETGSTVNTETSHVVTMYKKHIKANQYNYPDLINKNAAVFYLANNSLSFTPAVRDKIVVDGETFQIDSIVEHRARGELVLYKLVGIRG
jgi:hypothetical protein